MIILLLAFTVNLPFGYFRNRVKKYSLKWFMYIHIPIPFVVVARLMSHLDFRFIPLFILASIAGQLCGGRIGFN
ncbi:MAG: hypothetical protein M1353_08650 [Nitrospirae bacterium]|nr:hypothetical protein [Nitrospirota bacterium]